MSIQALTIDFWNTLVVARTNGRSRHAERLRFLSGIAQNYSGRCREDEIEQSLQDVILHFDATWKAQHRTPQTSEIVQCLWDELDIKVTPDEHAATVQIFQEGILHHPPALVEGVSEILLWASKHFRIGIISDTMFSPGRVIRRLLDDLGISKHFDAYVFSDETGYSKPDVRAFHSAAKQLGTTPNDMAHIGDLRRTDIAGAQNAGAMSILFTGVHSDEDGGPSPTHTLSDWLNLPDLFENT